MKSYMLDDAVIAQIVKILQLGLLTGTDVTDHMRLISLEVNSENRLILTKQYLEQSSKEIDDLLDHVDEIYDEVDDKQKN